MISRSLLASRNVMQTFMRRAYHRDGGVPCENMPFQTLNRYKLTLIFSLFLGSGFAVPFIAVRHQLTK